MKKLALCTALPEKDLEIIKQTCEVTVCGELKPCEDMCKNNREEALRYLTELEEATSPKK